jgi:hypothetical protein
VSHYLEQLIGAERRAMCLANDALLSIPKESATCEITVIRFGEGQCRRSFPNPVEADSYAHEQRALGRVVIYGSALALA